MPDPLGLVWDKPGERVFHTGVDRGVLYLLDGTFAAWNGLVSVESGSVKDLKSFFMDGVKYLEKITPGEFSGKLKAVTYPDEFDRALGIVNVMPGLEYHDQIPECFNLSYRTLIGNDISGTDFGYKIHLLYNVVADPDTISYETVSDSTKFSEFSWGLSGTPPRIVGHRPTVHISIDSTDTPPDILSAIEAILYGSESSSPRFPDLYEVNAIFGAIGNLIIIDNGDGSWTALDLGGGYISMLNDTTFEIANADAEFIDATTYEISTTITD